MGRRVVLSGLIRDRVVLDGDQAGRVVDVEVSWGGATRRRSRLWLLLDSTDHSAVGLNRAAWNAAELETVRRRLDLPSRSKRHPGVPLNSGPPILAASRGGGRTPSLQHG